MAKFRPYDDDILRVNRAQRTLHFQVTSGKGIGTQAAGLPLTYHPTPSSRAASCPGVDVYCDTREGAATMTQSYSKSNGHA